MLPNLHYQRYRNSSKWNSCNRLLGVHGLHGLRQISWAQQFFSRVDAGDLEAGQSATGALLSNGDDEQLRLVDECDVFASGAAGTQKLDTCSWRAHSTLIGTAMQ